MTNPDRIITVPLICADFFVCVFQVIVLVAVLVQFHCSHHPGLQTYAVSFFQQESFDKPFIVQELPLTKRQTDNVSD